MIKQFKNRNRKIRLIILINTAIACMSYAQQNLVPNASFENFTTCPHFPNQINYALDWFQASLGDPNLYNICDSSSAHLAGVPSNNDGNQWPRTGNGYAGMVTHFFGGNYREYIEVKLTQNLIAGNKYLVSFYVSLADTLAYACGNMGVYFSQLQINVSTIGVLPFTPQIANNPSLNPLFDKVNWILVSDTFTANGSERYMTIGNFDNDTNSPVTLVGGATNASYILYYIDDVSVVTYTVGLNELENMKNKIQIFPNPANSTLYVSGMPEGKNEIVVYDIYGRFLLKKNASAAGSIDVSLLSDGVYNLRIKNETGEYFKKRFVVIK
jgi:hypothetical protein